MRHFFSAIRGQIFKVRTLPVYDFCSIATFVEGKDIFKKRHLKTGLMTTTKPDASLKIAIPR